MNECLFVYLNECLFVLFLLGKLDGLDKIEWRFLLDGLGWFGKIFGNVVLLVNNDLDIRSDIGVFWNLFLNVNF